MSDDNEQALAEAPLIAHLLELRNRLLKVSIVLMVGFIAAYVVAEPLYAWLSEPLRGVLPEDGRMLNIKPAGTFFVLMKVALFASVFVTVPYTLYHVWAFVAPGLYKHERKLVWPLMLSSTFLFYLGAAFAYFVVLPAAFFFFNALTPTGVENAPDINEYLGFVMAIFLAFGAAFEVPIATILVIWSGITTREALAAKRPYIIVAAFVIGMLLTPPDVVSQFLLALPVWLLFEMGLFFSRWFTPHTAAESTSP